MSAISSASTYTVATPSTTLKLYSSVEKRPESTRTSSRTFASNANVALRANTPGLLRRFTSTATSLPAVAEIHSATSIPASLAIASVETTSPQASQMFSMRPSS